MNPCASTTAGKGPRPVGTLRTPLMVYDSEPLSVLLRVRYVTSYEVYAEVLSRTAPRRSRSPVCRCSARPSTLTGRTTGSRFLPSLLSGRTSGPVSVGPDGELGLGDKLVERPVDDAEDSSGDLA